MLLGRIISLLVPTGCSADRLRSVSGLGVIIFGMLAALLPQANVMGQFGFNVPYSDHDLSDPNTIDTFKLHSNPGASKVIYMDFDGYFDSAEPLTYLPYDFEGGPGIDTDAEKKEIRLAWQSVAEDFLPFNVNVTTKDPGIEALRKTSPSDTQWGIRAVVSASRWNYSWAYVGSFNWDTDYEAFAWAPDRDVGGGENGTDWLWVADSVNHEVGHTLGLRAYPSTEPIVKGIRREGIFSGFFSLRGGAHDVTKAEPLRMVFAR
jgi:hypothetical protein